MSNTTTNYNLTKPLEIERYDVQVFNNNADIIDAQMKSNADNISTNASDISSLTTRTANLENLNTWTIIVEFDLSNFTYDSDSGVTYLRIEAPGDLKIEAIRGYFVLNKSEADSSTTATVIDMTNSRYLSELNGTICLLNHPTTMMGVASIITANINLDLQYAQSLISTNSASTNINWATSPQMTDVKTCGRSIAAKTKYETTSFTLKTNVPYTNISEFYGKLQYRALPVL